MEKQFLEITQDLVEIETEVQLWDRIDQSLAHAKQGEGRDADDVINDIIASLETTGRD